MAFDFDEEQFQGPIPGESFTHAPGKFPFDRPPQIVEPEEALQVLFTQIEKPKVTNRIMDALSDELPLELLVAGILESMSGEGVIPVTLMPVISAPLEAFIEESAKVAKVKITRIDDIAPPAEELLDVADLETLGNMTMETPVATAEQEDNTGFLVRPQEEQ